MNLINKKLLLDNPPDNNNSTPPLASHIEAVKLGFDSEEPISFGPTATVFNYGSPWILQTVVDTQPQTPGLGKGEATHKPKKHSQTAKVLYSMLRFVSRDFLSPLIDLLTNVMHIQN